MVNNDLFFYKEYEQFYEMAGKSCSFADFCREAFGEDFSQDGFSDIKQIDRISEYIPKGDNVHILDIGCGNGKMLGYLQKKTGAFIHGFDYSENAINAAKQKFRTKADFICGRIGEVDYAEEKFDVITSMDSLYFAPDIPEFLEQIMKWLKSGGVFFVGYQEGDLMPKTDNCHTTVLARVLIEKGIKYNVYDITRETYDMLVRKRQTALQYEKEFEKEGNKLWFDMLLLQTDCIMDGYNSFAEKSARYIYIVRK